MHLYWKNSDGLIKNTKIIKKKQEFISRNVVVQNLGNIINGGLAIKIIQNST